MKQLRLAFLWHMHQPYYKDDIAGEYRMPWVFLHAIKDYYEMLHHVARLPGVKATFNLVPSLIIQLQEYGQGLVNDDILGLIQKETTFITQEERQLLCKFLFYANEKTMIAPLPRYRFFLDKKNTINDENSFAQTIDNNDLLDLEILFLLSWCGSSLREQSSIVKSLISQGERYTETDKKRLFEELFRFISAILPYYASLQQEGKIEIATTPFYHPILPLLLSENAAKEADGGAVLPKTFADFSDDAKTHVKNAVKLYESVFSCKPKTVWPAEGSVSNAALSLLAEYGIQQVGADEDVLFKSLESRYRSNIYKKYRVGGEKKIGVLFRDKALSDLIGFSYAGKEPNMAADDFLDRIRQIYDSVGFEAVIPVILDGENAWEYYENNAKAFFEALYAKIASTDWCKCETFSEIFSDSAVPEVEIQHIRPGSWIGGTFSTWMGHPEKNSAWELLSGAKTAYEQKKDSLSASTRKKAHKELLIAEGSDWFWWYGDDHFSLQKYLFDELFRKHLINIYSLIQETPPSDVFKPICTQKELDLSVKPSAQITPSIDGRMSDYYEWLGAGCVALDAGFSAMDSSGFHFEKLYWGYDEENIYACMTGKFAELLNKGYLLLIEINGEPPFSLCIPLDCGAIHQFEGVTYAVQEAVEFSIPKRILSLEHAHTLLISFEIQKNRKMIERAPVYGGLRLDMSDTFLEDWYV